LFKSTDDAIWVILNTHRGYLLVTSTERRSSVLISYCRGKVFLRNALRLKLKKRLQSLFLCLHHADLVYHPIATTAVESTEHSVQGDAHTLSHTIQHEEGHTSAGRGISEWGRVGGLHRTKTTFACSALMSALLMWNCVSLPSYAGFRMSLYTPSR
jgi:hypothetical protein